MFSFIKKPNTYINKDQLQDLFKEKISQYLNIFHILFTISIPLSLSLFILSFYEIEQLPIYLVFSSLVFAGGYAGKLLSLKFKNNMANFNKLLNYLSVYYCLLICLFKFILLEKVVIIEKEIKQRETVLGV